MDCACPDSLVQCTLAAPPRGWLINYGPNPNPGRACLFPDTKETSKPLPRRPSFSPSFRMEPIIVISGNHDDDDETRLAALDEPTIDVKVDSWIHNALQLRL